MLGTGSIEADIAVILVLVVAAVGVAMAAGGTALLLRTQRLAAERIDGDRSTREAGLEAKAHLLEYRAEVLLGHVRALEVRRSELEHGLAALPGDVVDPHALLHGLGLRSPEPLPRTEEPRAAGPRRRSPLIVLPDVEGLADPADPQEGAGGR